MNLRLTAQPSKPGMMTLHFEVEDTGPGISPEELPEIFDAFVQSQTGRDAREGTGLGLTISRQFVRLMGGEIVATSQLGHGSCFQFDVQVRIAPPDAAETWVTRPVRRVIGIESAQPTYRLLVAEDSETNRELLTKLLAPIGFQVRETGNGLEAIEACGALETTPDLYGHADAGHGRLRGHQPDQSHARRPGHHHHCVDRLCI